MDIMGFFSYLDHCEVERDSGGLVWREPKTPKEYVEAMEHIRVNLVMYKVYQSDDEWEVADNARPYVFIPEKRCTSYSLGLSKLTSIVTRSG